MKARLRKEGRENEIDLPLFWMVREPDWASAPVLSRRLKKIPTPTPIVSGMNSAKHNITLPSVMLTFHVRDVVFNGSKVTRAAALGWPAGSMLVKAIQFSTNTKRKINL